LFGVACGSVQECVPLLEQAHHRGLLKSAQSAAPKLRLEEIARVLSPSIPPSCRIVIGRYGRPTVRVKGRTHSSALQHRQPSFGSRDADAERFERRCHHGSTTSAPRQSRVAQENK
jgi:hypothetical protein